MNEEQIRAERMRARLVDVSWEQESDAVDYAEARRLYELRDFARAKNKQFVAQVRSECTREWHT